KAPSPPRDRAGRAPKRSRSAFSACASLLFQPQFLRQRAQALLRRRVALQGLSRIGESGLRLVLLIQHFIGANKALPFLGTAAVGGEALRQTLDHGVNGFLLLVPWLGGDGGGGGRRRRGSRRGALNRRV